MKPLLSEVDKQNQQRILKIYQENIRLKKEVEAGHQETKSLKAVIQRLRNQQKQTILNSAEASKRQHQRGASSTAKGFRPANNVGTAPDKHKMDSLLEIIDHYKSKLLTVQEDNKNLTRKNRLLCDELQFNRNRSEEQDNHQGSFIGGESMMSQSKVMAKKSMQKQIDLEREKCKFRDAKINQLELKIKMLEHKQQECNRLASELKVYESRVMKLTQIHSAQQGDSGMNSFNDQFKVKELQEKLKATTQKMQQLKDQNQKADAEIKILQKKIMELTVECDRMEKEANMNKPKKQDLEPLFDRLRADPHLLKEAVAYVELQSSYKEISAPKSVQKVLIQKQALARELQACQAKLKAMETNAKQAERISALSKDKKDSISFADQAIMSKLQASTTVQSKSGVLYDEDVSMFVEEKVAIPSGTNYMDVYLGELKLLPTMVQNVVGLTSVASPFLLATVDFYNHNTVHSKLVQGLSCDLQSQFSFKVTEDEFFLRFLGKGALFVEIWASEGGKNIQIGRAKIDLMNLAAKSKPRIATVINTSTPIYMKDRVMGALNLVVRIRLPIHQQLASLASKPQAFSTNLDAQQTKRKLIVSVEQGRGLSAAMNTFVYYSFRLEDHYSGAVRGANPYWNHYNVLEVTYNDDLKNYLRRNQLQFTVFDDNATLASQGDSDVVGSASLALLPLLQSKEIKVRLDLKKGGKSNGTIDVRVFWHDQPQLASVKNQNGRTDAIEQLHKEVYNYFQSGRTSPEVTFSRIDGNKSGLISFQEFHQWLSKLPLERTHSGVTIRGYYDVFKQPLNKLSFMHVLSKNTLANFSSSSLSEIGLINKIISENTIKIHKKTLKEYLKGKDLLEVSLLIDKDRNGKITNKELNQYFEEHDIQESVEAQGEIDLLTFLKRHFN